MARQGGQAAGFAHVYRVKLSKKAPQGAPDTGAVAGVVTWRRIHKLHHQVWRRKQVGAFVHVQDPRDWEASAVQRLENQRFVADRLRIRRSVCGASLADHHNYCLRWVWRTAVCHNLDGGKRGRSATFQSPRAY